MNKNMVGLTITIAVIGLSFYLLKKKRSNKQLNPQDLVEPLKSLYYTLKEKGYNPRTSLASRKNAYVAFDMGEIDNKIQIVVNSFGLVLIEDQKKAYKPIKYSGRDFTINDKIVSDKKNLFEGVLEILENKSYEE